MRSIALLVVISTAAFVVVVDARSLARSVQLKEIPVKVIYDTDPLETVYTKVIVKGMATPNESANENDDDDRQVENKFDASTGPEEVLAVVEEVTKDENDNRPQADILQVPVNVVPQSDLEVIVQPGTPSNKESTITEVAVNLDGSEITKDGNKVELSQELLPPAAKPSAVVDDEQNELSDVEQNNKINENVSDLSPVTEKREPVHANDVDAALSEEQNERDKQELLYALRFSESHPAQVPTRKSSAAVKEENRIDGEDSSTEDSSTAAAQPSTEKVERPKPIAFIQNLINTVRPTNVVQAIVNRNKGNANDKKDGTNAPETAAVVEENVYVPPKLEVSSVAPPKPEVSSVAPTKQEDAAAPSSPISSFQTTFNSQLDNFRETVNSALNSLRPTPRPDAESDATVQRPFVDALQSTFNNGVNTLSNSVNNAIASLAPQSNDQSVAQQLQNVIQNGLNQFGQSVSGALNLRPRPESDADAPDETQTGQNIAQIIQSALNSFVENINNFNKKPTDGTTALHDEETQGAQNQAAQSQGPFAVALNGLQNFISNFRPSERPTESGAAAEGGGESNRPPNPLQLLQNAGQSFNNFISNLRPTRKPSTDNKEAASSTTETAAASDGDKTPNAGTDEKPDAVDKPEKEEPSKSD